MEPRAKLLFLSCLQSRAFSQRSTRVEHTSQFSLPTAPSSNKKKKGKKELRTGSNSLSRNCFTTKPSLNSQTSTVLTTQQPTCLTRLKRSASFAIGSLRTQSCFRVVTCASAKRAHRLSACRITSVRSVEHRPPPSCKSK